MLVERRLLLRTSDSEGTEEQQDTAPPRRRLHGCARAGQREKGDVDQERPQPRSRHARPPERLMDGSEMILRQAVRATAHWITHPARANLGRCRYVKPP